MTPTAMLADYVLPGDVFSERNHIADSWSWGNRLTLSQKAVAPPAEASSTFQFWAELGFDPLPYYREGPALSDEYPSYAVFTGVREDAFFQTGQRNIAVLRERSPSPKLFLHPTDADKEGLVDGDWVKLTTMTGEVQAKILVQESMKQGHIRVPHGWWYPELRGAEPLAGAFLSSDAVLCADADEFLDYEQGIPHFKGFPGRLTKIAAPQNMSAMVLDG